MFVYQPPGSGNRLPEGLCVVSTLSEVVLYSQLLKAVEDRLQSSGAEPATAAHNLLRSVYELACPLPNSEVIIKNCVSLLNNKLSAQFSSYIVT